MPFFGMPTLESVNARTQTQDTVLAFLLQLEQQAQQGKCEQPCDWTRPLYRMTAAVN